MGMGQPTEPRIFVSHSHADNSYCREFVVALRKGLNDADGKRKLVWYDESNMTEGELLRNIQPEIYTRPIFVVMLSQESLNRSNWVNTESQWGFGYYMKDRRTHRFLPVTAKTLASDDFGPDWVFLQGMLRIEGPSRTPLPPQEAAQRVLAVIHEMPDFQLERKVPASDPTPQPAQQPVQIPATPSVRPPDVKLPSLAEASAPTILPERMKSLGFSLRKDRAGVAYILPPVVPVPAGPFLMGSDAMRDRQAQSDEQPQRSEELGAFQIAVHPTTVAEYACFVNNRRSKARLSNWDSQLENLDHPVVHVDWDDAFAYAVWLKERTDGQPWRLATEAEWEKSARGTDGRIYPWGDTFDPNRCNTTNESMMPRMRGTTKIGTYAEGTADGRSPYGAQDMAGNVWEWTDSLFMGDDLYRKLMVPLGSGGNRIFRGGSWYDQPHLARSAYRRYVRPSSKSGYVGFRVALASPASG